MKNGFSLIEIVVALFLLSVGFLGLINGLFIAHHHAVEGLSFSQAYVQAENMYENMRANPVGVEQGAYYQEHSADPGCRVCEPYQQAAKEIFLWDQQLNVVVPESEGGVKNQGDIFVISVMWQSLVGLSGEFSEEVIYGSHS